MLPLEISAESNKQNENGDCDERGAQGFADVFETIDITAVAVADGRIKPKQLRNGYADTRE